MSSGIVAILTDFGDTDAYVGIMEAVMLRVEPSLRFIRLTQAVPPQDLRSAAYLAATAWPWLPAGSVLLAVIDPGVGSERRELILEEGGRWLVCPDNGLSTLLAKMFPGARSFRMSDALGSELKRAKPLGSNTFDGRDLFSPLAARIAAGRPDVVGHPVVPRELSGFEPARSADGSLASLVLHVDHFGNCITSIRRELPGVSVRFRPGLLLSLRTELRRVAVPFGTTFSSVEEGAPVVYWGSSGFLELGVRNGSAASVFGLRGGSEIVVDGPAEDPGAPS